MSSGGTDRICQNAASADNPRIRSCHALATVLPRTCSGTRTTAGQAPSRPRRRPSAAVAPDAGTAADPPSDGSRAAPSEPATSPTCAGGSVGRTVLTRPVCTPDGDAVAGPRGDDLQIPPSGGNGGER